MRYLNCFYDYIVHFVVSFLNILLTLLTFNLKFLILVVAKNFLPIKEIFFYKFTLLSFPLILRSYQYGPDTYLLQLRDVDFPVRLREYMKVAKKSSTDSFDWHVSSNFSSCSTSLHTVGIKLSNA